MPSFAGRRPAEDLRRVGSSYEVVCKRNFIHLRRGYRGTRQNKAKQRVQQHIRNRENREIN